MPLCSSCDKFDIQLLRYYTDESISLRYSTVKRNSELGCEFCSLLLEATQHHLDDFKAAAYKEEDENRGDADDPWIRLTIYGKYNEQIGRMSRCRKLNVLICNHLYLNGRDTAFDLSSTGDFYLVASQESPAYKSRIISGRYVGQNRCSPEFAAAIKKWVDGCITNHKSKCCVTVSGRESINPRNEQLPSRCIYVGGAGHAYLAECSGKRGSYIILSHRWTPETESSRTTRQNYSSRMQDLDISRLPVIFRYVIALARELGVQYIWIDSICILQDDTTDLRRELLNMAQYYQHSLFTLAAELKPESDNETLSIPRPFNRLVRLPHREAGKQRGCFYVFKQKQRTKAQYLTEVDQSELLSRGWVFQEWFLSARIVHLTPSNTFLECRTQIPRTIGNQSIEAPDKTSNMPDVVNRQKPQAYKFVFKSRFLVSSELDLDVWYELLALSYSRLSLTKATDHLNAIAGIAAEFTKVMSGLSFPESAMKLLESTWHSSYASGLWLPDIHHGLLWRGASEMLKLCGCGAPSWSWLTLEGQVAWPQRHPVTINCCEIVSIIRDVEPNPASYLITMAEMLRIKGKIQSVLSRGQMTAAVDEDLAALTGDRLYAKQVHWARETSSYKLAALGSQGYQVRQLICPIAEPTVAAGWGTFERPDLLQIQADGESYLVNALQVSIRKKVNTTKLHGSLVDKYGRSVTDVLFVEPVVGTPGRSRRIGVGAIYKL
ncbi:heterokaryon incompatibility protein domain-containing protein, partial [Trichoderma evansii]